MTAPHVAYVLDPRFPGGTSAAVAAEIRQVAKIARVSIFGLETEMFKGREIAPQLATVLSELRLEIVWGAHSISADTVLFHNPSCLRFQNSLGTRIAARHIIVITHENFVRPSGAEAFDVGLCLNQLKRSSFALRYTLAPLSSWNRTSIAMWSQSHGTLDGWETLETDWFNICEFELTTPSPSVSDRRGRLSRPGFEKFPQSEVLNMCFPAHAERNIILGADTLMMEPNRPAHWTLYPFRSLTVSDFFEMIDFMIYFTAPTLRESFGRVLAESIAAGKVVISDPETAETFGGGVISAMPEDVDRIVRDYIDQPSEYVSFVKAAQDGLSQFSGDAFLRKIAPLLTAQSEVAA